MPGGLRPGGCLLLGGSPSREGASFRGVPPSRGVSLAEGGLLCRGSPWQRGVSLAEGGLLGRGGSPWQRGSPWQGGLLGRGVVASQHALRQTPPLVNRMTDRCKNITLATTSLRPVMDRVYNKLL